jgi:LCP family protein required for cell wall assembly
MAELTRGAQQRVDELSARASAWPKIVSTLLTCLGLLVVSGALYSGFLFFTTLRAFVARTTLPILPNTIPIRDDVPLPVYLPGQDLPDLAARNERLNILLLGIDAREQETGPFRTDTMILLSLDIVTKSASMLSIPRDLWVTIPGFGEDRVNTAHVYGDVRDYPGGGIALAKKTIQHNLGVPVHRAVRISFPAFEKIIDAIGGVTIDVPRRLYDDQYPDENYGYMTIDIPAGVTDMDGRTALQYARSRHSTSDYDRMARQQQVILAARDKVLGLDFPLSRIPELIALAGESLYTDLPLKDIVTLAELAMDIDRENIRYGIIDDSMTVTAVLPSGAMVEVADWNMVRDLVRELFPVDGLVEDLPDLVRAQLAAEGARIELQNGSLETDLAADLADVLREEGLNVVRYDNADRFDYAETLIIDRDGKDYSVAALAEYFQVPPERILHSADAPSVSRDVDVVVILGRDAAQRAARD